MSEPSYDGEDWPDHDGEDGGGKEREGRLKANGKRVAHEAVINVL